MPVTRLTGGVDTLIVWTEPGTNIDMALSFQEADGCAYIWCVLKKLLQGMLTDPSRLIVNHSQQALPPAARAGGNASQQSLAEFGANLT